MEDVIYYENEQTTYEEPEYLYILLETDKYIPTKKQITEVMKHYGVVDKIDYELSYNGYPHGIRVYFDYMDIDYFETSNMLSEIRKEIVKCSYAQAKMNKTNHPEKVRDSESIFNFIPFELKALGLDGGIYNDCTNKTERLLCEPATAPDPSTLIDNCYRGYSYQYDDFVAGVTCKPPINTESGNPYPTYEITYCPDNVPSNSQTEDESGTSNTSNRASLSNDNTRFVSQIDDRPMYDGSSLEKKTSHTNIMQSSNYNPVGIDEGSGYSLLSNISSSVSGLGNKSKSIGLHPNNFYW